MATDMTQARPKDAGSMALTLCFTVFASLVAYRIGVRCLVLPLEKFLKTMRSLSDGGEPGVRADAGGGPGEIVLLAEAFNEMVDVLQGKNIRRRLMNARLTLYTSKLENLVRERTADLLRTQKHVELILDSTSEGILELDIDNRITFVNRAALSMLDYGDMELTGRDFFEFVEKTEPWRAAIEEMKQAQLPGMTLIHKSNGSISVDAFIAPILIGGERKGSVLTFLDITDSLARRRIMNAIYSTTSNGYVTFSENCSVLDCNPGMLRLLGLTKGDMPMPKADFLRFSPIWQPDGSLSSEKFSSLFEEVRQKGSVSFPWTHMDTGHNLVPCTVVLTLIGVNRHPLFFGSVQDMRDHLKAHEALKQQREQLQRILESSPIILAVTVDDQIRMISRNGTELLGLSVGDSISRMYSCPEEREKALQDIEQGKYGSGLPMSLQRADGGVCDALLTFKPFSYERERALLIWIVDITELERARRNAEAAALAKSDFLAGMSHEIRTPMNAILGMSHLCLQTRMTEKQYNYLHKIHGAATALLSLINDILDFSKIEAGKLSLENVPFRLSETLRSLWDLVAFRAEEKGILFTLDIGRHVPNCFVGDPLRLNRILINLCNNAIKFTERGEIVVRASVDDSCQSPEEQKRVKLLFSVTDTGIGMTPEQLSQLFRPFVQADGSITRRYGGTGLGLTICRHLVESMNGAIEVRSQYGKGTTVLFFVDLEVDAGSEETPMSFKTRELRVLTADGSEVVRNTLYNELVSLHFRPSVSATGAEMLEKIRTAIKEEDPYAFVLMNWKMPDLSGEELVTCIRRDFAKKDCPRIVMLASGDYEDCLESCAKLGLEKFLALPVSRSDLYDALVDVLEREYGRQRAAATLANAKPFVPDVPLTGKVLLVEDNATNQEIAIELLEQVGISADIASNGEEAVIAVKNGHYDLIFMDVQMPVMDGLEATGIIRGLEGCEALPIVAMTAHAMKGDYEKSLDAGMNDHITKPISPQHFYRTLYKWMRSASSGESGPEAEKALPPSRASDAGVLKNPIPGLVPEDGLLHVNGNATLYRSLLRRFPEQYGEVPDKIKQGLEGGDIEEARRLIHTIKGVAASMGMTDLSTAARRLEEAVRANASWSGQFSLFAAHFRAMVRALGAFEDEAKKEPVVTSKVPDGADREELKRILGELPSLLNEDLMKAWEESNRAATLLADTVFDSRCADLCNAVRDCDDARVTELGQALLLELEKMEKMEKI
jgi:PAS domain S-box-containing protein